MDFIFHFDKNRGFTFDASFFSGKQYSLLTIYKDYVNEIYPKKKKTRIVW